MVLSLSSLYLMFNCSELLLHEVKAISSCRPLFMLEILALGCGRMLKSSVVFLMVTICCRVRPSQ